MAISKLPPIPGHLAEIVGLAAVAPQSNLSPQVLGGRVGFRRGLLLIGDRLDHKGCACANGNAVYIGKTSEYMEGYNATLENRVSIQGGIESKMRLCFSRHNEGIAQNLTSEVGLCTANWQAHGFPNAYR